MNYNNLCYISQIVENNKGGLTYINEESFIIFRNFDFKELRYRLFNISLFSCFICIFKIIDCIFTTTFILFALKKNKHLLSIISWTHLLMIFQKLVLQQAKIRSITKKNNFFILLLINKVLYRCYRKEILQSLNLKIANEIM